MMKLQLSIYLEGEFDGHMLEVFRHRLGLRKRGRLTDDWDEQFGSRTLDFPDPRGEFWLDLSRETSDSWVVELSYEVDPLPADEMERLRQQTLEAAAEVGVTVTRQVPPPDESDDMSIS